MIVLNRAVSNTPVTGFARFHVAKTVVFSVFTVTDRRVRDFAGRVARRALPAVACGTVLALAGVAPPTRVMAQGGEVVRPAFTAAESPLAQSEILARVRDGFTRNQDVDDVAADVDRRGIAFAMDEAFGRKIRFLKGASVESALWRADDRRKAVIAKPTNAVQVVTAEGDDAGKPLYDPKAPFIEQARATSLAYVAALPDFIVRQQVQRYTKQGNARWQLQDSLEIAIAYSQEKGEKLDLKLQKGVSTSVTLEKVGGLTSTGQFAGQLKALFDPQSETDFRDEGTASFYGQTCRVFAYTVLTKYSKQELRVADARVTTGYRGRVFLNTETRQVVRMESECFDIPADFPVSDAISVVEFGWVSIGDRSYFLPVNARVALGFRREHSTNLNCITFYKYGKFEADVKVD
jgi:hypothetical protein